MSGSGTRAAGFEIGDEIGRGGFGVVYRARQVDLDRTVAIKILHGGATTEAERRRFEHECRVVGALPAHPAIVAVHHAGVTDSGAPFLAMAYLPGGTLAQRMPLPADEAARIAGVLADGLAVAHAGGVVHRDVKPANVLFDRHGSPVLVDFGIASLVGDATGNASIALSLAYASPETLDGAPVGPAADVYALGATLFAAITGSAPFDVPGDNTIARMAVRIATEPVEDLRPRGVPDSLCQVIETAMAKDPADRFASMSTMQAALAAARRRDAAALTALLPGAPRSARRRAPRPHRAALAALVAAAVVGGGGYVAYALSSGSAAMHPAAADRSGAGNGDFPTGAPGSGNADAVGSPSSPARSSGVGSGDVGSGGLPGVTGGAPRRSVAGGAHVPAPVMVTRAGRTVIVTARPSAPASRSTAHPTTPKPTPRPTTAPKPPPRATLAGQRRCLVTAKVATTVSIPEKCPKWRADWHPARTTSTVRLAFIRYRLTSSAKSAGVDPSGSPAAHNTFTIKATKPTTVRYYYRIESSYYDKSTRKWRTAGASTRYDYVEVIFKK